MHGYRTRRSSDLDRLIGRVARAAAGDGQRRCTRRLENLKSFDDFLEKRFPESRRKAYYLMSIQEHLPPQVRKELKVGWTKGLELAKVARSDRQEFDCATWCTKLGLSRKSSSSARWNSI